MLWQLFPTPLKRRLSAEAKKTWDIAHSKAIASVMASLAGWAAGNPDTTKVTPTELREKEDLDARLEYLNAVNFEDPGPVCHTHTCHTMSAFLAVLLGLLATVLVSDTHWAQF
jgi:hypothetical protein